MAKETSEMTHRHKFTELVFSGPAKGYPTPGNFKDVFSCPECKETKEILWPGRRVEAYRKRLLRGKP